MQVGARQYRCNPHQLLTAEKPPPSSDKKLPVSLDPDKQTQEPPEERTITDDHLMQGNYQEEPVGETRPPDISIFAVVVQFCVFVFFPFPPVFTFFFICF